MSEHQMQKPPWESALYEALGRVEIQLRECKAENAKLRARVADLTHRLENWKLRRDTWHREREQLMDRLKRAQAWTGP